MLFPADSRHSELKSGFGAPGVGGASRIAQRGVEETGVTERNRVRTGGIGTESGQFAGKASLRIRG